MNFHNWFIIGCLCLSFNVMRFAYASPQDKVKQRTVVINTRPVIIQLPVPFDTVTYYPLLIALHGNGGIAANLASLFGYYQDKPAIIAVPQGQYPAGRGEGHSWFYETRDRSLWEKYDSMAVDNILMVINDIGKRYKIGNVHVMGFSQGASLAYMTGLKYPDRINGIIAVGGFMPDIGQPGSLIKPHDIRKSCRVPLLIAHGNRDIIANKSQFLSQIQYFRIQGYSVTEFEFNAGHTLTIELLDFIFAWILNP